jgi:hypothetical protein
MIRAEESKTLLTVLEMDLTGLSLQRSQGGGLLT